MKNKDIRKAKLTNNKARGSKLMAVRLDAMLEGRLRRMSRGRHGRMSRLVIVGLELLLARLEAGETVVVEERISSED